MPVIRSPSNDAILQKLIEATLDIQTKNLVGCTFCWCCDPMLDGCILFPA